jgi:hypothetical protein
MPRKPDYKHKAGTVPRTMSETEPGDVVEVRGRRLIVTGIIGESRLVRDLWLDLCTCGHILSDHATIDGKVQCDMRDCGCVEFAQLHQPWAYPGDPEIEYLGKRGDNEST